MRDLHKSMDFYSALGFTINPQFSDDTSKCLAWSEHIFLMILTPEKFTTFATKPLTDTNATLSSLYSFKVESIEEMNRIVTNGLRAGGKEPIEIKDYGFMQLRTIEDFDGHTWEIFFMDQNTSSFEA